MRHYNRKPEQPQTGSVGLIYFLCLFDLNCNNLTRINLVKDATERIERHEKTQDNHSVPVVYAFEKIYKRRNNELPILDTCKYTGKKHSNDRAVSRN